MRPQGAWPGPALSASQRHGAGPLHREVPVNGHIDLVAIVLLLVGGVTAYAAYKNPNLGAALLTGAGVITVVYLLMNSRDDSGER